ncbi:fructose-1,6-bisphosphatase [Geodermatophilus obscurus]|jgi:fructose-1,6-bisphosphatase/inositol monophosphatase family enzyme|uniref:Fructose-1,6-bisphosphatase n=1 Tax=Geodermatophilus obscurus TaxID=1861 RepID=A0A1I5CAI1_9ACTN|nr:inositol monophosphatase [Geodermatophilus obscurus]SFN84020.1 fructose-1,6-bisphosphatase [Geodermatophilus obscurus]
MGIDEDLGAAREAVRIAGEVAAARFRSAGLAVTVKSGPGDVVTEADRQAEAAVLDHLRLRCPDDGVVGEEGGQRPGGRTWLVDAIDGTLNFVSGDPFWCSAVALVDDAGAVVSAVLHPATGELFSAARGRGCWLGDAPLTRGPGPTLANATLSTYLGPDDVGDPVVVGLARAAAALRIRGSGSLELAWVAAGRADLWVKSDAHPWDWHPGALLVAEAGGVAETVAGSGAAWSFAGGRALRDDVLAALPCP